VSRNSGRLALELRRSRRGLVALAVLLTATVIAAVVLANGLQITFPWDNSYTFQVAVGSAKGVVPGKQQVRIAGFPVGKITDAELIDGRPVLTMTIDGQYGPLYRNAQLRLRPKTPLDDLYMDVISRGTPSAGVLRSGEILPAERTIAPVDIGEVLDAFDADTRVRLKQAIDGLGGGLSGTGGQNLGAALLQLAPFLNAAQRLTSRYAAPRRPISSTTSGS
jgi:ABC-type transporter Mla subunit MlaD